MSVPVVAPTLCVPIYVNRGKQRGRVGIIRHLASFGPIVEWLDGSRNIIGWGSIREFKVDGRSAVLDGEPWK